MSSVLGLYWTRLQSKYLEANSQSEKGGDWTGYRPRVHTRQSDSVLVFDRLSEAYTLFNQVEVTTLNATYLFSATGNTSPDTGKYTAVNNPRNIGITMRLDF
jgi:hypothetical protein